MRGPFTSEMIAELARCAGFEFAPERCALLAPQLEWLLSEGEVLERLLLEAEEPALVFHPDSAVHVEGKE
jgi:hypothetical protein